MAPMADAAADIVRIAARAHERDRYLAALLAPSNCRADLIALAAFAGEIGRIPAFVTEPMMGQIRLQWWRERLESASGGGHPVADALLATVARHSLSPGLLTAIIDAHGDSLEERPFADDAAVLAYVDRIDGSLFALAARIVGADVPDTFIRDAGRAYGLARLLLETPATTAHGRLLLPISRIPGDAARAPRQLQPTIDAICAMSRERLTACAGMFRHLSRPLRTAFLPLALVEPYLHVTGTAAGHGLEVIAVPDWQRTWRVWRHHRTGKL
jgi:15-cis-phytoene synthase